MPLRVATRAVDSVGRIAAPGRRALAPLLLPPRGKARESFEVTP